MLTKNTFLFTGAASGSSCRERKGYAHSHLHAWELPSAVLFDTGQLHLGRWNCLAKGHLSELWRVLGTFSAPSSSIFPSTGSSLPLTILSVAFTFRSPSPLLSLAVTHQQWVRARILNMSERRLVTLMFSSVEGFLPSSPTLPPPIVNNRLHLWVLPSGLFSSLMILVVARSWKIEALTDPQRNRAFIFQLFKSQKRLKCSLWRFSTQSSRPIYQAAESSLFCAFYHDLTIIKMCPLRNRRAKKKGNIHSVRRYTASPCNLFTCFHTLSFFPLFILE